MEKVKLAVIYYSATGANKQMAEWAAEGARDAGAEVRVVKVKELAPESAINENPAWKEHYEATKGNVREASVEDLEWADAFIFSIPTRYGNMPSQLQQFIDLTGGLWYQGKLVNKVVSAMSSAQNPHGGQETTILTLYKTMYHWGALPVSPGYTDKITFASGGNPYGTSVTVDGEGNMKEDKEDAIKYQAKRTVEVAGWVKKGMAEKSEVEEEEFHDAESR